MDVNADYLFGQNEKLQQITNNGEKAAESTSKVRNYLYAVKAVASTPIGKGHFSIGTEETFTNRHDLFLQSGFSADADNHVKQSSWSAFANYSLPLGKWNLSAGFRYEHQQTDYYENNIYKEEQSPVYNDFIPTLSANYRNGDWNLNLSYKYLKGNPPYSVNVIASYGCRLSRKCACITVKGKIYLKIFGHKDMIRSTILKSILQQMEPSSLSSF